MNYERYTIEQAENGYILNHNNNLIPKQEIYTHFREVVERLAFLLRVTKVGEKATLKIERE